MGAMTKYAEISTMKIGIPIHTYGRRKWINKWAISESLQASVPKQGEMGGHWSENNLLFQWWIQGRGPGGPPPPPLFLDHTEVRRAEIFFLAGGQNFFFFETAPHPRHISGSGWPLPPPYLKVWIRHCILMQIKLIFIWKVLHLASLWKWECSESGNGQLCIEKGGKFEWFINIVPRTFHEKMGGAREPWGRECFWRTWEVQMVKEST